jgi:hypothetical protein
VPDTGPPPELVAGLREVLRSGELMIVDWCRCWVVSPDPATGPDSVAAFLSD